MELGVDPVHLRAQLASADLEPVFRAKPALHRYPGSMAKRVHDLAVHVRDRYDGDAARVWTDASDAETLRANLAGLPGFGEMKVKALGAVLAEPVRFKGKRVCCVISGGNADPALYARLIEGI